MANMQTDVKNIGQKMDEKNEKYRPAINKLLKANGHGQRRRRDQESRLSDSDFAREGGVRGSLIKTVKNTKSGFDATHFIAGLLIAPEGKTVQTLLQVAKKIIDGIAEENAAIDLDALESDLEAQDRTSDLFYGGDDLSHDEVVAATSKTS